MCFSAEADLVAGVVVTGIGVEARRHVRAPRELALAALPTVLGANLLVEVLAVVEREGLTSLRCGRAAVTSVVIAARTPRG